jgi:hypothetical protein
MFLFLKHKFLAVGDGLPANGFVTLGCLLLVNGSLLV